MSSLFDSLSEELFQVLKGCGMTLTLYDDSGNKTYEPKSARRVFATPANLMVSVIESGSDSEVKLYLSQSTDVKAISKLINTLRQITTRYNVLFNVRKFGRELSPKDFAYQASMNEASMWGTTKTSYQKIGPTKLIIRHTVPVREGVFGSRGRNILSMFVETVDGERFKFPENHLSAGRAFAQHIAKGGKPHDETSLQIVQLATESLQLSNLSRYIFHSRNFLGEQALDVRTTVKNRLSEIRKAFTVLARPRGYDKIKEEGLPLLNTNLSEDDSLGKILKGLQDLLQIDSNHALAESLMPVALLTMGENMNNMPSMFHGVLTLEEAAADALVEALTNEYGFSSDAWTRFGSNIAFNEAETFEEALGYLDLVEAAYQLNEEDAVLNYATQWTNHRIRASGATDAAGNLIKTPDDSKDSSVEDLATGLRAILGDHIEIPDFPEHVPGFADGNAKARFYLDLYVSQNKLANPATLNYVSSIIDKMAEGHKLDGAEKTISGKLIKALEDDLMAGEDDVDESVVDETELSEVGPDHDFSASEAAYSAALDEIVENFDEAALIQFIKDYGDVDYLDPEVVAGESDMPLISADIIDSLAHYVETAMDQGEPAFDVKSTDRDVQEAAKEIFETSVKPVLSDLGWTFTDTVKEFAIDDEEPAGPGISIGDHVATHLGSGTVVNVEGDMATVELFSGKVETMLVDDLEKVEKLGGVAEEAELAEWFETFDPMSVLEAGATTFGRAAPMRTFGQAAPHKPASTGKYVNWANAIPAKPKADPTNPEFSKPLEVGDRVTHKTYGSGEVLGLDDKLAQVVFDEPHARIPADKVVTLHKGVLTKAGAYRKPSIRKQATEELGTFGVDSSILDEAATISDSDMEEIMAKLKQRADEVLKDPEAFGVEPGVGQDDVYEEEYEFKKGLARVLSDYLVDMIRDVDVEQKFGESEITEGSDKSGQAKMWIEWDASEDGEIEIEVDYSAHDGSFATGLDYPKFHSYGPELDINGIVNVATGEEIDFDSLDKKTQTQIHDGVIEDMRDQAERDAEDYADFKRGQMDEDASGTMTGTHVKSEVADEQDLIQMAQRSFGNGPANALRNILAGQTLEDQSPNALKYAAMIADEEGAPELAAEIKAFLAKVNEDEVLGGDVSADLINDVRHDNDSDLESMSDDELFMAHKNAWKGRGTLQALERMDKIKDILAARGKQIESIEEGDVDAMFREELERVLKNAMFRK